MSFDFFWRESSNSKMSFDFPFGGKEVTQKSVLVFFIKFV